LKLVKRFIQFYLIIYESEPKLSKLKNKVLIVAFSLTVILAVSFSSFLLFSPTRTLQMPWQEIYRSFSAEANSGDSIRINQLNNTAFELRLENPTKTIILADSSLKLAIKANYISGIGEAFRVKGIGHSNLNDNDQAVKNYFEAIKYFKIDNDLEKEARVLNNIGLLYKEVNHKKALFYYNKALQISMKLKNSRLIAGLYYNIAFVLIEKRNFNNAKLFLEKSNQIFKNLRDTTSIILYYQNAGVLNFKLNNFKKAKESLFQAKSMAKDRNLFRVLVGSDLCLSEIYLKEQNFLAAEKTIKEGIHYSNILKDSLSKYYFIHHLYKIEKKQNNTLKAFKYLIQIHKFDSLQLSKNQSDYLGKTTGYYTQQQKIQENELTIAKQKYRETLFWWIITIIFSLVLLSTLIGIITFSVLQRKRKKKDLEIENKVVLLEQKTLQAMVNPHFIFNILNTIQFFIYKENTLEANRILAIFSQLMRKQLEICLKNSITLTEELEYLSLYLTLEKTRFSEKMEYNITIEKNIDEEETIIPPMLIQPFIENAIWHGIMPKETGGKIDIDITCEYNILQIKITDNGVGITNSINNKSSGHISRGLELIEERVNLLNKLSDREISINKVQTGESGTEVLIKIPV
jgi:tetratricopeptide (TPR) repeat protein